MNIFILDLNHEQNVRYYVDKHVVKMPVETAQILSIVYYFANQPELSPYKLTHSNHTSDYWLKENGEYVIVDGHKVLKESII